MLKLFKIPAVVCLDFFIITAIALMLSACGTKIAGGVDEETNTLASDIPQDSTINVENGKKVDVVIVDSSIHALPVSDSETIDVPQPSNGEYTHVIRSDLNDSLTCHTVVKGSISGYGATTVKFSLALPDSTIHVETDENGIFELQDLPNGTFPLIVENSSDGYVDEVGYILQYDSLKATILGPVPASVISSITADELIAPPLQTVDVPGIGGTQPKDSSDAPSEPDSIVVGDSSDSIHILPSGNGNDGAIEYGFKVQLPHKSDYGLVYHWTESDIPANGTSINDELSFAQNLDAVTIEVTLVINSFSEEFSYSKNIFGKSGLFSLALVKIKCWERNPALTFFIDNGFETNACHDKAVVSSAELEVGKEISVTAVWSGKYVMLYMNGFMIAQQTLQSIPSEITVSDVLETPFVFGDNNLDITIKDVRLGNKAINSADVLYRYYLKGGDQ